MKLIVHQAALGDFVLLLPTLRSLNQRVLLVSHWSMARLAQSLFPYVDPIDANLREFTRLFDHHGPAAVSPFLQEAFEQTDGVISFVSNGHDDWADNIKRLTPNARHAFLEVRPPADWSTHTMDWQRAKIEEAGIALPPAAMPSVRLNPKGSIVMHPGSGGADKCWPIERFAALREQLIAQEMPVSVVLGEVECERWPAAQLELWKAMPGTTVCRDLETLRRQIEAARLFVGNDSGPTHLAAQLGISTIALFGPTFPAVWQPVGPQVHVLAPPKPTAMDWLSVDKVRDQLCKLWQ